MTVVGGCCLRLRDFVLEWPFLIFFDLSFSLSRRLFSSYICRERADCCLMLGIPKSRPSDPLSFVDGGKNLLIDKWSGPLAVQCCCSCR